MYEYSKGMSVLVVRRGRKKRYRGRKGRKVRGRKEDKERWKEGKKGGSSLP